MLSLKRVKPWHAGQFRTRSPLSHNARDASPWRSAAIAFASAVGSALLACGALSAPARAQGVFVSHVRPTAAVQHQRYPFRFHQQGGAALYHAICQGCHMPNAKGACGAGCYPALARNPALAAPGFAVRTVVNGLEGMPAFGRMLTARQIADVLNYIRTHFGNHYSSTITPAQVNAAQRSAGAMTSATHARTTAR